MKNIILTIGLILTLCGCEKKSDVLPQTAQTTSDVTIYLGIFDDGSGFWDWDGTLQHEHYTDGNLGFSAPMKMKGTFSNLDQSNVVELNLEVDVDENDNYLVKGVANSKQKASLILVGTGDSAETDEIVELPSGESAIDFIGKEGIATFPKQ